MAMHEAISIIMKNNKLAEIHKSFTLIPLKYLFDCYNRVEVEERQYTKVKKCFI